MDDYLSNIDTVVNSDDVEVTNTKGMLDDVTDSGSQFNDQANEVERIEAYTTGDAGNLVIGEKPDKIKLEPQFGADNKDVDAKLISKNSDGDIENIEYVEFKRLSGNDFDDNLFDNLITDDQRKSSANRKFLEIGDRTEDGSENIGEITIDYDRYNIDSDAQAQVRISNVIDKNIEPGIVKQFKLDRVRVKPVDGKSFEFIVSDN